MPGSFCSSSAVARFTSIGAVSDSAFFGAAGGGWRGTVVGRGPVNAQPRPESLQPGRTDAGHGAQVVHGLEAAALVAGRGDAPGQRRAEAGQLAQCGQFGAVEVERRGGGQVEWPALRAEEAHAQQGARRAEQESDRELGRARPGRGGRRGSCRRPFGVHREQSWRGGRSAFMLATVVPLRQ
jgi:hypothetical protein